MSYLVCYVTFMLYTTEHHALIPVINITNSWSVTGVALAAASSLRENLNCLSLSNPSQLLTLKKVIDHTQNIPREDSSVGASGFFWLLWKSYANRGIRWYINWCWQMNTCSCGCDINSANCLIMTLRCDMVCNFTSLEFKVWAVVIVLWAGA